MKIRLNLIALSLVIISTSYACKDSKSTVYDQCLVTQMKQVVNTEEGSMELLDKFTYNNSKQLTRWVSSYSEGQFEALFTYGTDGKLSKINVATDDVDGNYSEVFTVTHLENLIRIVDNDPDYPTKIEIVFESGKVTRYDEFMSDKLSYQTQLTWKGNNVITEKHYSIYNDMESSISKSVAHDETFSFLKKFVARNKQNRSNRINRESKKQTEMELTMTAELLYHDSKNGLIGIEVFCFMHTSSVLNENNPSQVKFSSSSGDQETINYSNYKVNDTGYPIKVGMSTTDYTSSVTFSYQCD